MSRGASLLEQFDGTMESPAFPHATCISRPQGIFVLVFKPHGQHYRRQRKA